MSAVLYIDGFDKYGVIGTNSTVGDPRLDTLMKAGEWTDVVLGDHVGSVAIAAPLAGVVGKSLAITAGDIAGSYTYLKHDLYPVKSRLVGGFRFKVSQNALWEYPLLIQGCYLDTPQWTIELLMPHVRVCINAGAASLTPTAQNTTQPLSSNAIYYIEFDITNFGYLIKVNGSTLLDHTESLGAPLDSIRIGCQGRGGTLTIDDLYLSEDNILGTFPLVETSFANQQFVTDWTPKGAVIGEKYNIVNQSQAPGTGGNKVFLREISSGYHDLILNNLSCIPAGTSVSAKLRAVLYSGIEADAVLLAVGSEITGVTAGTVVTSDFDPPYHLTRHGVYGMGFLTSNNLQIHRTDTTTTGVYGDNVYANGAPLALPAMTTGAASWQFYGQCDTPENWTAVDTLPVVDGSYTEADVRFQKDLFSFQALYWPVDEIDDESQIYATVVKAYVSGDLQVDLITKSGLVQSNGDVANLVPAGGWVNSVFDGNPAGGRWTKDGLNNALSGIITKTGF